MSETTYYAIYTAINIACTVCTIVGQTYINSKATPPGRKQCGDCVGSNCFIAGTLVLTAEGYKKIEDIQVGDKVLAYDEVTGETAYKHVVRLFRNETTEWYHIHVNEEEMVCTAEHPFYVPSLKQFVPAKHLKVGTELLLSDGTSATIDEIHVEKLSKAETTYNFEVEDYHTYYVTESNVLVHNDCGGVTDPKGKTLYRGGNDLLENLETDILVENGMVQPGGGPSLNTSLKFAERISGGRGAYTLDRIPDGLGLLRQGGKGHYVIQALYPMPKSQYINLLKSIILTAVS